MKEFILGGARSGKSALAERLAHDSGLSVTYVATATPGDEEMAQRIRLHRARRPRHWELVEEPLALGQVLIGRSAPDRFLLVDCITLWLSNLLQDDNPRRLSLEKESLLECLPHLPGPVVLVSNEVGMGIVPLVPSARRFLDEAGRLHQELAQRCGRVVLTVAGLPHVLKGDPL